MGALVKTTQGALTSEEATTRHIQQRNLISDSLRLLNQAEAALIKGYPMALLEIFAEGPTASKSRMAEDTGMDFGELTLLDDDEMLAQVELSKAQQSALHTTDAVLADLNTLVSSAQGLRRVQPERNPLRPESYIRALQQVVGQVGVPSDVRQLWMQHMRGLLGDLLVVEYKTIAKTLREHGVQPVGYAVAGGPSGAGVRGATGYGSGYGSGYGPGPGSAYGSAYDSRGQSINARMSDPGNTGYGRSTGPSSGWLGESQQGAMAPEVEEALLTVGILRQMLAGGDPFDPRSYGGMPALPAVMQPAALHAGTAVSHAGILGGQVPVAGGHHSQRDPLDHPSGYPTNYPSGAAAEAVEDMAQLERLVGRLAGGGYASRAGLAAPLLTGAGAAVAPVVYASMPLGVAHQSPARAVEVLTHMMENIAQDARLLAPVQQAVKRLGPPLTQLVQIDTQFFSDDHHPARRLLDELTQRSLSYPDEAAPGFSGFIQLATQAVDHLCASDIKDASLFELVLKALQPAWDIQAQKAAARHEAERQARLQTERRALRVQKLAADVRKLSGLEQVPPDVVDFAAGPWAEVVARAQEREQTLSADASDAQNDPRGFWALIPVLFWSAQPELACQEPDRLIEIIPELLAALQGGLQSIDYPAKQTDVFLQRLTGLHQVALERTTPLAPESSQPLVEDVAHIELPLGPVDQLPESSLAAAPLPLQQLAPDAEQPPVAPADPYADFKIGAWVELITSGRRVRTQLTWASPNNTLFLFTAPDASTQSMTRRMRDKLVADGSLQVVPLKPAGVRPRTKG